MKPRPAVRLVDVAERAGVTASTASRALHRPELVRPETRRRVEEAAEELGYQPNLAARFLITGQSQSIAVIVPDLANTYFALICRAAKNLARERGYEVYVMDTDSDPQRECEIVESVSRWVDGIIICIGAADHAPPPNDVPIVYVNRQVAGAHAVMLDQAHIARTQLAHLQSLGHERILFVEGPKNYWASETRVREAELRAVDTDIRIARGFTGDFAGGMAVADAIPDDVTAIATFNDRQAFGLLNALLRRGVRVPEEVSIIGSDDVPSAEFVNPALTTVHSPKEEMGRAALSLLVDHLTDERRAIVETLRGHLVVRESTAPPPGAAPVASAAAGR